MDALQIIVPAIAAILVASIPALLSFIGLTKQLKAESEKRDISAKKDKEEILKRIQDQNALEDESLRCLLSIEIVKIYFKHEDKNPKQLAQWEAQNEKRLYEQYSRLGGNGYIEKLHKEMEKWTVVKG